MKTLRVLIPIGAAALLLTGIACSSAQEAPEAPPPRAAAPAPQAEPAQPAADTQASGQVLYACSMGCEVADEPGRCSKCGMEREAVPKEDVTYACTLCGVSRDDPGTCEKCGMALQPRVREHGEEG